MGVLCSGSFVADIIVPDLPCIGSPGSLIYAPNGIHLSPGGHSSNVAIDLAQLGVDDVYAVGSLGGDALGRLLVELLTEKGVCPLPEFQVGVSTAKNVALLVKGEDRRYISELTANSLLSKGHLLGAIAGVEPGFFYQGTLGGLSDIEENLSSILRETRRRGALTFVDVIMPSGGWGYLESSLGLIDVFHANREEALDLVGVESIVDAVRWLTGADVGLAVVSDGHNGVTVGSDSFIVEMPAYAVESRDPTGAGDALSAGIIKHLIENNVSRDELRNPETVIDLLLMGQAVSAACVTGIGATTNVTMENVENILEGKMDVREKTVVRWH
jgi:fructokinase